MRSSTTSVRTSSEWGPSLHPLPTSLIPFVFCLCAWLPEPAGAQSNRQPIRVFQIPGPVSISASPTTGIAPLTVKFSVTTSPAFSRECEDKALKWSFGDRQSRDNTASGATPTHTFLNPGRYTVQVTYTPHTFDPIDAVCLSGTERLTGQVEVIVEPPPRPPNACIAMPDRAVVGQTVALRSCSEVFAEPAKYIWTLSDDDSRHEGDALRHTFSRPGSFTITLSVVDSRGLTAETSRAIAVLPPPLQACIEPFSSRLPVGESVTFDGSCSIAGEETAFRWTFSDDESAVIAGRTASHTFGKPGRFVVRLELTETGRGPAVAEKHIQIDDRPLAARFTFSPKAPTLDDEVRFDAGRSVVPIASRRPEYSWDWADGTQPGTGVTTSHRFTRTGKHQVTLIVRDENGQSDAQIGTVEIVNRPPVAVLTVSPNPAEVGAAVTFDASGSSDPDGEPLVYSWVFADSSFSGGAKVTRSFGDTTSRIVQVTVTDRGGLAGRSQATLTIVPIRSAEIPPWVYLVAAFVVIAIVVSRPLFTSLTDVTAEFGATAIEVAPDRDLCRDFLNFRVEIENDDFRIEPESGIIGTVKRGS